MRLYVDIKKTNWWRSAIKKRGKKMIRRKQGIEAIVKNTKRTLSQTIDKGLADEAENEKQISRLKKKLKELSSEVPYEDTLQGKIEDIESKTFKKVTLVLGELSEITGNEYSITGGNL